MRPSSSWGVFYRYACAFIAEISGLVPALYHVDIRCVGHVVGFRFCLDDIDVPRVRGILRSLSGSIGGVFVSFSGCICVLCVTEY